jgi:hypothetical protein
MASHAAGESSRDFAAPPTARDFLDQRHAARLRLGPRGVDPQYGSHDLPQLNSLADASGEVTTSSALVSQSAAAGSMRPDSVLN